jgi:hypothetical protein
MDDTLPTPLIAARAALVAAETNIQTARNERNAAAAALANVTAAADADTDDADLQAAVPPAQQRVADAEQAIGDAEDDAAAATIVVAAAVAAEAATHTTPAVDAALATLPPAPTTAAPLAAPLTAPLTAPVTAPLTAPFTAPLTAPLTTPLAVPPTASPAVLDMAVIAAILQQNQQQNQQMMQMFQHFVAAPPQAPTTTTTTLPTTIIAVPYNINMPPSNGKDPEAVRHNTALDFPGPTAAVPVHAWLNNMAAFCKLHKTSAPSLLASGYLIKGASAWFHATYGEQDMYKVFWKDFSSAMLHSYMVDSTADQRLLDKCKTLSQGVLSIKDYLDKSNDIYQNRKTHPFLKDYNEHFFIEMFRSGLHRDTQSRLPAITADTTYETYTTTALRIAAPLEALAGPAVPAAKKPWQRFNRSAGAEKTGPAPRAVAFGAVTPMPPAGQDEVSRASWELANLTPEQRRQARMLRGACTYCGISTHLRDSCPELAKRTGGVNGVAAAPPGLLPTPASAELSAVNFTIDSGNGQGATQY